MRRWGRKRGRETERRRRRETPGITQARRYKTLAPRAKRCAFAKHKHEESEEAQSLSYTRLGRRPAREVESVKSFLAAARLQEDVNLSSRVLRATADNGFVQLQGAAVRTIGI